MATNSDDDWIYHAMSSPKVWCRESILSKDIYYTPDPHDDKRGLYVVLSPASVSTGRFSLITSRTTFPVWWTLAIEEVNKFYTEGKSKYETGIKKAGLTFLERQMSVIPLNEKNYKDVCDIVLLQKLFT